MFRVPCSVFRVLCSLFFIKLNGVKSINLYWFINPKHQTRNAERETYFLINNMQIYNKPLIPNCILVVKVNYFIYNLQYDRKNAINFLYHSELSD